MKALVFGSCNLDIFFHLPHIVGPGETIGTERVEQHLGGKGFNQAIALSRAGAETWLAGNVGEDGGPLRAYLRGTDVNASLLADADAPTGKAYIQIAASGENSIIVYPGANFCVTKRQADETLARFAPGDLLLLQNEVNELPYLIERAHERGLRVVLNPSPFADALRALDPRLLSLLIVNETECAQFSGGLDPEAFIGFMREKAPGLACVVTLGSKGSIYFDRDTVCRQGTYPVKAVDTTGAGDTFTGFFCASYFAGDDVKTAMERAAAAAAITVSRVGAAPAIPTAADVDALLRGRA